MPQNFILVIKAPILQGSSGRVNRTRLPGFVIPPIQGCRGCPRLYLRAGPHSCVPSHFPKCNIFAERREIRKSRIYEYVVDMLVLAYALTLGFEAHSNHQSQRFVEEFWVWGRGDMSLKTSTMTVLARG